MVDLSCKTFLILILGVLLDTSSYSQFVEQFNNKLIIKNNKFGL